MNQDDIETLIDCPACARCMTCGGARKVDCRCCTPPKSMQCGYCSACAVCDGKGMTTAERAVAYRATLERF